MIEISPVSQDEQEVLLEHYRKAQSVLIRERAHAVLLSSSGKSIYDISQILFRDEKTIRGWITAFQENRIGSIFPRYRHNQNAAKLTVEQKAQIKEVLSQSPSEFGLPKAFWTVKSLRRYVQATFGVVYESDSSYHFLFKLHNYSFHLPELFNIRRDDEVVRNRIAEIRVEIKPLLENERWEVFAVDESRLVWEAIVRRAWLPKGQKTVLKVHTERNYQSFFGALNLKNGKPHIYYLSWQNQKEIITALRKLINRYPDKQICIIWDNARWHKGKQLKELLSTEFRRVHLINLPAYAPDHNPQEQVWKYGKDEIADEQLSSMTLVSRTFKHIIMSRSYPYQF